ncbi:MAG TPA: histidine kinase, partial [Longimicrobium sp.]
MSKMSSDPETVNLMRSRDRDATALVAFARRPLVFGSFLGLWGFTFLIWTLAYRLGSWGEALTLELIGEDVVLRAIGCLAGTAVGWWVAGRVNPSWWSYGAGAASLVALAWGYPVLANYAFGGMRTPYEVFTSFPNQFSTYAIFAVLGREARRLLRRERERVDLTRLAARLAQTRTQSYQARLQPEFILQCLDAITARIHTDPADADRLLLDLSDLLRLTIQRLRDEWVTLRSECEFITVYFALARDVHVCGGTLTVHVPSAHENVMVPAASLSALFNSLQAARLDSLLDADVLLSTDPRGDRLKVELAWAPP